MGGRRGAKATGVLVTLVQQQFAWLCGLSPRHVDLTPARLELAVPVQHVPQGVWVLTDEP